MAPLLFSMPEPRLVRTIANGQYNNAIRESRRGVMLHYDASGTDDGAMGWFGHPDCKVSYQWLVLDDGSYAVIAPEDARAWHAGHCKTSNPDRLPYRDANSAFWAIALATNDKVGATEAQRLTAAWLTRRCFRTAGWLPGETWRIVGHDTEAVFPAGHRLAGQRGRKIDPTGSRSAHPILAVADVRFLVPLILP